MKIPLKKLKNLKSKKASTNSPIFLWQIPLFIKRSIIIAGKSGIIFKTYLSVKLEGRKTNIYAKDELFRQCKL